MAKAYNQNFYSLFLYGSQSAGGSLTLQANDTATPGVVQVVGTSLDLYVGGIGARLLHANTALRTYTLPDLDGTLLSAGLYTGANQILFSTGANAVQTLSPLNSAVLTSSAAGVPAWVTGTNGQFLQISGGIPAFGPLPANVGTIASSVGNTLPVYQSGGPSNSLVPLATSPNMLLGSPGGALSWTLVTASYLAGSGNVPLGGGVAGQKLRSNGDGTFVWANDPAVVNPGPQNFISYYSAPGSASTLSASGFVTVDEVALALSLANYGKIRLYEQIVNGTAYVELKSPISLGGTVSFTLPGADGAPGAFLKTDGAGNLSFISVNNGVVNSALANQLAYYPSTGNQVSGLATSGNRVLLSPSNVPTWGLVSTQYLAGLGNAPLSNGTPLQVLTSNGDGTVSWTTASSITGSVSAGNQYQAAYYPIGGTNVQGSSFLNIVDPSLRLDLTNNGVLRFYELASNGGNFVQLQVPALVASSVTFTLPAADGTADYALVTDGFGSLSFREVGNGVVGFGAANSLALYSGGVTSTGYGTVAPLATAASRALLSGGSAAPAWSLITAPYLQTTAGAPLDNGLNDEVLTSDGSGNFVWQNVSTLLGGGVGAGSSGAVTFYKNSGTAVQGSSFLSLNDPAMSGYSAPSSLQLTQGSVLQMYNAGGFYAQIGASPSMAGNAHWYMPASDAAGALVSDGAGTLSFQSIVQPGSAGSLAYYTSSSAVGAAANVAVASTSITFGGTSFALSGVSGATPCALSIASGSGVGVAGANLRLGSGSGTTSGSVQLQVAGTTLAQVETGFVTVSNGTSLRFLDAATPTPNYVGFAAPATVTSSVVWSLPSADGSPNQLLSTDGSGALYWQTIISPTVTVSNGITNAIPYYTSPTTMAASSLLAPAGSPTSQSALVVSPAGQISYAPASQGNISVQSGAATVTVLYDTPFASTPAVVTAQWSVESATSPSSMPTIAVLASDAEGFTLQFSTTTTQVYTLYWSAQQNGYTPPTAKVFFAGGYDGAALQNSVQFVAFDTDTTVFSAGTLSAARGYTAGTSSSTDGFILGGKTAPTTSSNAITTFTYATSTVTDQGATLTASRSDATGVGTRAFGYDCGGQTLGTGSLTSIGKVDQTTIAATVLPASLTAVAVDTTSANSTTTGYVVHSDANSTVDKLNFATETVTAGPSSFGAGTTVRGGCNDNVHSTGYFVLTTGDVYSYTFATDTIASVGVSTGTDASGAGNSLVNGYIAGTSFVSRLSFGTATLTTLGSVGFTASGASISTFQTNGLI